MAGRAVLLVGGTAVAVLVLVGIMTAVAAAPRDDDDALPGGPLAQDVKVTVDAMLPAGGQGSWGVVLSPTEPVTLESVALAEDATGLEVLGIDVASVTNNTALGTASTYPPPGVVRRPVAGAEVLPVAPGEATQLVIGIGYPGPQEGRIDGLRIRYVAGGQRYETVLQVAYHVTPLP